MLLTKLKTVKTVCCSPEVWAAQLAHAEESFGQVSERYIGGDIMHDIRKTINLLVRHNLHGFIVRYGHC